MVFPPVPVYVDQPNNWNLQQAHQLGSSSSGGRNENPQLPPPPGLVGAPGNEAGMICSIRPGPMAERARLGKIAQPEHAHKCPRCDSTNTKFCYFNNYSLSQPRHFCKACRRYWTRGGALRNIPVGGGCRRNNKRTKSGGGSSLKSSVASANRQSGASSSAMGGAVASSISQLQPQPPLITSLHRVPDCGVPNLGLSYAGIQSIDTVDHQVRGTDSAGPENLRLHWQIHQFPLILGGLEPQPPPPQPQMPPLAPLPSLYPSFVEEDSGFYGQSFGGQVQTKVPSSGLLMQLASVKMEDNAQELSLPRQILGGPKNDLICGGSGGGGSNGGGWATDFSWFNPSSIDNFL